MPSTAEHAEHAEHDEAEHSDEQYFLHPHIPFLRRKRTARQMHVTTMTRTIAVEIFMMFGSFPAQRRREAHNTVSMLLYFEETPSDESFFLKKSGIGRSN